MALESLPHPNPEAVPIAGAGKGRYGDQKMERGFRNREPLSNLAILGRQKTMNIRSSKKYLLLMPLVVTLIMLTFFSAAYEEIIRQKHEQKFHSIQISLDLIASQIDRFVEEDDDWGVYDYISLLRPMIIEIDSLRMVYAELFDHNLVSKSDRIVEDQQKPFNPFEYDEFVQIVMGNDGNGELILEFDDGLHPPYAMHVYYRKIPSGGYDNKCVAVIGVGKHAIEANFAPWLIWGMVGMIAMTILLQVWMILHISKLADAEQRARQTEENGGQTNERA
jgi:hypothetical protein